MSKNIFRTKSINQFLSETKQDGVIFHELRRKVPTETREEFYARILHVMAQMGGGSANVL